MSEATLTHRRYSRYLRETFGGRTYKITVSSGLSCPTRDGTKATGGCAFCDVRGSSSYFGKKSPRQEIRAQIERRLPEVKRRFSASHFLAYFQSYTNTYGDVAYLEEIYQEALSVPGIEGLCIGTRPDCLTPEIIALLERLAKDHYVSLELGVQSLRDESLLWLERGHDAKCSLDALDALREHAPHVHTCAHLMFGTPGETIATAREAAIQLSARGVKGVKLHQLMVLENTELARRYRERPFPVLSLEEYAEILCEFLEHLAPEIYIERLYALASHRDECLAPEWSRERWRPQNELLRILNEKNCAQGRRAAARPGLPVERNTQAELVLKTIDRSQSL